MSYCDIEKKRDLDKEKLYMSDWDKDLTKNLLLSMEKEGYPFADYYYEVRDQELVCLGRGSYSRVYEVSAVQHPGKRYALKVIGLENGAVSSEKFNQTTLLQRFLGEKSQNVVGIIGVKEVLVAYDDKGTFQKIQSIDGTVHGKMQGNCILLQFLLMDELKGLIEKDKFWNCHLLRTELTEEMEILRFGMQIGQAILTAHRNHVIHRDIKLENIFWNEKQQCYQLGDFGIAKQVDNGNAETVVYTDGYGAPEIERRLLDHYDVTADIYSFGICLYLLFNELRFPGADGYIAVPAQYDPEFVFPAPLHGTPKIARFLRKACSYDPSDRFQSMEEMLGELSEFMTGNDVMGHGVDKTKDAPGNVINDIETETYREDKEEAEGEQNAQIITSKRREGESESAAVLRAREKKEFEKERRRANGFIVGYITVCSLLFFLFLVGLPGGMPENAGWTFLIFPIMVLAESVFLMVGELHILFGIMTLCVGIYSMGRWGINLEYCLLFASLISLSPVYSFPCSIGVLLWGISRVIGTPGILVLIGRLGINWVLMALLCYMIRLPFLYYRMKMEEEDFYEVQLDQKPWDLAGSLLIIIGLLFFVLEFAGICVKPELVSQLHLIPAGILVYVLRYLSKWISYYF